MFKMNKAPTQPVINKPAQTMQATQQATQPARSGIPRFGTQPKAAPQIDENYLLNQMVNAKLQIPYVSPGNYILCVTESRRAASENPLSKGAINFSMRFLVLWCVKTEANIPIGVGKQCSVVYKCGIPGATAEIASGNYLQHLATMYAELGPEQLLSLGPNKISELNAEWANDSYSGQLLYCEAKTHKTRNQKEITRYSWTHIAEDAAVVAARRKQLESGEVPTLPEEIRQALESV